MIYLDNSATTAPSDTVLAAYIDAAKNHYGNPSSLHAVGFDAEGVLKTARGQVMDALGTKDGTLVFTSSGSEANNLAIFGRAMAKERFRRGAKIFISAGEHASVSHTAQNLASFGITAEEIPTVGGTLDLDFLSDRLGSDTVLVSVMMVNNETGALYDVAALSALVHRKAPNAYVHVDATQSFMKVPFTPRTLGCDMITVSSHKIEGPKGMGALWVRPEVMKERGIVPLINGGGQESGLRSGTENVPGIVAFGVACREAKAHLAEHSAACEHLREYLLARLAATPALAGISPTLPPRHAPHILNLTVPNIKSETMLHFLSSEGICVSSGSACSSNGAHHASAALQAFGRSEAEADASIRVSFSYHNTEADVDALVCALERGLARLARVR